MSIKKEKNVYFNPFVASGSGKAFYNNLRKYKEIMYTRTGMGALYPIFEELKNNEGNHVILVDPKEENKNKSQALFLGKQ